MQKSRQSDTLSSRDETNFESFRTTQNDFNYKVEHGKTGTARLIESDIVEKENLPSEYINNRTLKDKHYLVFEAILGETDKTVKVICPTNSSIYLETALEWTNSSSVKELAGEEVPIRHIKNSIYEVESFISSPSQMLDIVPLDTIKKIINTRFMTFENGRWYSGVSLTVTLISLITIPILISIALLAHLPIVFGLPLFLMISFLHVLFIYVISRAEP